VHLRECRYAKIATVIVAVRERWLIGACGVLGALAVGATVAVAAAAPPTGNAGAIAFYKQSRNAMAAYQGIDFTGGGTSYKVIPQAGGDIFKFDFGSTPRGYAAAVASVRVVQHKGVITEEIDTLKAPGKPAVRVWQDGGTEVGELLTAKPCTELIPANSASFVTVGHRFVGLSGSFAALTALSGSLRVVSSSYSLAGGTAHERDTIAVASHLWRASHLVIAGGPNNHSFLTESDFSYSHSQRFVTPPTPQKCR
jgi:hypothetical protein